MFGWNKDPQLTDACICWEETGLFEVCAMCHLCWWTSTQITVHVLFHVAAGIMLTRSNLQILLSVLVLFLLWKETQGRCSYCASSVCSQTGMSQGWTLFKYIFINTACFRCIFHRNFQCSELLLLHSSTWTSINFTCIGNVTGPGTTEHPISHYTMLQPITQVPARALSRRNVVGLDGIGAQHITPIMNKGKSTISISSSNVQP